MTVTTEIKEENGAWVVTETAKTPQGDISDKSVLEKGTLVLSHRSIKQGPVAIEIDFKDNKASGTMNINGQSRPIAVDLGGDLFADGAGAHAVLASLPLAAGYTATFRNFDIQTQKVKLMQIKVVGEEKITVPAGSFDAFKLEVASAEGEGGKTTVWVDKATRKVVKTSATLPQMGGAVVTSELTAQ
jgi:hypothetical protein